MKGRLPSVFGALGVGLVVALAVLPVGGLLAAILDPPPDPFGAPAPSLGALWRSGGTGVLLARSLALGIVVAGMSTAMGTWLAWAEHRFAYPGRRWLGIAGLLPMAMPSYILAATLAGVLGAGGWLGGHLGMAQFSGFWTAVIVLSVVTTPYVQLVVGTALVRLGAAEAEAAATLGAGPWRVFRAVLLPHLRPALAFSAMISVLYAVSDFGAVAVLNVPVLTWRLYEAVQHQALARAALLGLVLLAATLPLFALARWLRGAGERRGAVSQPRPAVPVRPGGPALALTYGLHLGVIGLGVVLPLAVMGDWVGEGISRGLDFASPWRPVLDSTLAAAAGAVLTVLLAAIPAWWTARKPGLGATAAEQATYLTSALPGILVGFGLMLAALAASRATGGAGLYRALLGGGVLLFLGYALRFVAEAYGPLKTTFLQLDPRLTESARTLGAGPWRILRQVTGPAAAPGIVVALLICFVAILKELPVTLLLGSATGLRTLPFRVWDRYSEALWHDAGLAGLLLVGLALGALTLSLRWRSGG